jgi:hypothetical protein
VSYLSDKSYLSYISYISSMRDISPCAFAERDVPEREFIRRAFFSR